MKVDLLSALPTISTAQLAVEIALLGEAMMRVLVTEAELEAELKSFAPTTAVERQIASEAIEELRALKQVRADGAVDLITMVNEFNDREKDPAIVLRVPEALFNLMEV